MIPYNILGPEDAIQNIRGDLVMRQGHSRFKMVTSWQETLSSLPDYWPFVRGIHRCPVDSPHKWPVIGRFDVLFVVTLNNLLGEITKVNNRVTGDLRRYGGHVTSLMHVLGSGIHLQSNAFLHWGTSPRHGPGYVFSVNPPPHDGMAAISQTIFAEAFLWMESFVFLLKLH